MIIYSLKYPARLAIAVAICMLAACNNHKKQAEHHAQTPQELQEVATGLIKDFIANASKQNGHFNDANDSIGQVVVSNFLYEKKSFAPIWSANGQWLPVADSLHSFIKSSRLFGLFPQDYHLASIENIRDKFIADSLSKTDRKDPTLWAIADIMLTDAFVQIVKDIKLGRLPQDSITLRKDSVLSNDFIAQQLEALAQTGITQVVHSLEPDQRGYYALKQGIKKFIDSADYKEFTSVPYPVKDSSQFLKLLQKRLFEGGFIANDSTRADSAQLADAIKRFQKKKNIAVDGRAGEGTIRMLNVTDREKFIRIAISMDKYKMLPEKMPAKYIWVNTSANFLELVEKDEVKLDSKVICGKARTRTPLLTSAITELITYPQWVPPSSIISKEILPAVKKNPGYLAKRGFSLVDSKGNEVDPYEVNWSKYSKSIPYRVVQGSGDANALGIMKFVFSNKYSVYLHDTNQRYLFGNAMRSLSHGCVRVQEWEKLAQYILRNDSLNATGKNYTPIDSMTTWLQNKQKKSIAVRNKIPVFIRYITCEGKNGSIVFYDDVYSEDKFLRERYFAGK